MTTLHRSAAPWDAEADAVLLAGWKANLTARSIAAKLTETGFPTTKNGVLGRLFRLRQDGEEMGLRQAATRGLPEVKQPWWKLFMDQDKDGCRYPEGDPSTDAFRFCDEPRRQGSSYCTHHHSIAWVKPEPKQALPNPFFVVKK